MKLNEFDIYGSKRIGVIDTNLVVYEPSRFSMYFGPPILLDTSRTYYLEGQHRYELTNHLGNVLATVSDRKWSIDTNHLGYAQYYLPNIVNSQDYYPFGMIEPGRQYQLLHDSAYSFGFNGKLHDDDIYGSKNSYDYGMRFYDPRLGRFLNMDKLTPIYPGWSPYKALFDNPIYWTDEDGALEWPLKGTTAINKSDAVSQTNPCVWVKRANDWQSQTGMFEGKLSSDYKSYRKNPNSYTIIKTSLFNIHRNSTIQTPMTSPHVGIDYKAQMGTDVYSLGNGTVVNSDPNGGTLSIKYGEDVITYRHLSKIDGKFKRGDKIYEGQIFAESGKTGTTQPHLHVEAQDSKGNYINPENKNYGTVTNADFFGKYGGDYKNLPEYKKDHPDDKKEQALNKK